MSEILVLITTESSRLKANNLSKFIIQKRIAACVSLKDIFSIYEWRGKIEECEEVEITIKSTPAFKKEIITFIKEKSSYEVPQIIYKEFNSYNEYLNWVNKSLL